MEAYLLIYTNCKNQKQADSIISHLLDKKLIACANSYPVKSNYSWKGKTVSRKEVTVRMKTRVGLYKRVEQEIKRLHSDEIPEILAIEIKAGLSSYFSWINEVTKQNKGL